jgi:uncharacterized protein (TIGR03437 family)
MKVLLIPVFFLLLAAAPASAVVTLGTSNQSFGLTGIGADAAGEGQSKMTWGACAFDGTNTTCTLSGPYTGFGPGGTYSFVVSYAGNGPFPLNAITAPGSNLFFARATSNSTFSITLTQNNNLPAISFYSFANFNFLFSSPICTGVAASACSVGQVGLTPNATITGPVTGTFDPTPQITTPGGAHTIEDYGDFLPIAPASWMVIYGVNLATTRSQTWTSADFNGNLAPRSLGGTNVTVAGIQAYVFYVSPAQVDVQVPSGVPSGPQPVVVTTAGGSSLAYTINVNAVEPGLLAPASFIISGNHHVLAQFSNTSTYVLPVSIAGLETARARPGDPITLYGIGFGAVTPDIPAGELVQIANNLQLPFGITFATVSATVNYSGLVPSIVGLYQFNVVVPNVAASDTVPVAFTLNGVAGTQNLVIAIQN